jgi:hypothetical protein
VWFDNAVLTAQAVPEPGALAIMAVGLGLVAVRGRW